MKKRIAILLFFVMTSSIILPGATSISGFGNLVYQTGTTIYDKSDYQTFVGTSSSARSFASTVNTQDTALKPYVYNGAVASNYTLTTMRNTIESEGYKVVAGINGDVYYSQGLAVPKGLTIHDGKIKSNGYASHYGLSFDSTGKASVINTTNDPKFYLNGSQKIDYFNVPHGGSKLLHLYNSSYGSSTRSTSSSTEVVADIASGGEPTIGGTITATVTNIRKNTQNTPICSNQIVLSCGSGSSSEWMLTALSVGDTITISVTSENQNLRNSVEYIGAFGLEYDNGEYYDNGYGNGGRQRTLVGIQPDGSLLLYACNGTGSSGMSVANATRHLVALGCTQVLNMDGGGSTTFMTRDPVTETTASNKNSLPSGQRAVSNGLFFVYRAGSDTGETKNVTTVDANMAMPGAYVYPTNYSVNSNYENPQRISSGISYGAFTNNCFVTENNVFIAGDTGLNTFVSMLGESQTMPIPINVYSDVTLKPSVTILATWQNQTTDINISAQHEGFPIASRDGLYNWYSDPTIGTINANGEFTAVSNRTGIGGNVTATYNGQTVTIPVTVGFKDIISGYDWVQPQIEKLWRAGIVRGSSETQFEPQRHITRAEYMTYLARLAGVENNTYPDAGFVDNLPGTYYYQAVNWAAQNEITDGISETEFGSANTITREEMATLLVKTADTLGVDMPTSGSARDFMDASSINSWATESVERAVAAGIIKGKPGNIFDPQGNSMKSESAVVIDGLYSLMGGAYTPAEIITGPGTVVTPDALAEIVTGKALDRE